MDINRRNFIKASVATGVTFSLGFSLYSCTSDESSKQFSPNAWLTIFPDNTVLIKISKVEMGQGVLTAIPMIIGEELEVNWKNISVELADASPEFESMYTGSSMSIRSLYLPLRQAGAVARAMLMSAAENIWRAKSSDCRVENSFVYHVDGRKLSFGELAKVASSEEIPENVELKSSQEFQLIGHPLARLDSLKKITGDAQYGIDTEIESLKYAAIKHAPVLGAKLIGVKYASEILPKGIVKVVKLNNAVAVVADSYWLAENFLSKLECKWSSSKLEDISTDKIMSDLTKEVQTSSELESSLKLNDSTTLIEADYRISMQAHVTMEPMNCTVHIHDEGVDVWVPTQHPMSAMAAVRNGLFQGTDKWINKISRKLGISDNVRVHPTLMGGGFGRRIEQDYVVEAIEIAKHVDFPVKLIWSREEDIRNDFFRPASAHKIIARWDKDKKKLDWLHKISGAVKGLVVGQAVDLPYNFNSLESEFYKKNHKVPVGSWRAVSSAHNAFVSETFIDIISARIQQDPLEFRLSFLKDSPRSKKVLGKLANIPRTEKMHYGYALYPCFGSFIAMRAGVIIDGGVLEIREIDCIADVGVVINPDIVRAQIEGGIIFGLNAAVNHQITIKSGKVEQSNFHDYSLLPLSSTPEMKVEILESDEAPGGVGEIGVPPLAPAVANAIFAATGKRVNSLPFEL